MGSPDGELSVIVVNDSDITKLNKKYLHREGPTNVISFPMLEGEYSDINPQLIGDVVISVETAAREGKEAGITMEERFNQLLVHGILHMFGYDHVKTEPEAIKMELKSNDLLELINQN